MCDIYCKWYSALTLCLTSVLTAGCTDFGQLPSGLPFQTQSSDKTAGVAAPAERIAQLKKLAKQASGADAAQRQRVATELARQFDGEDDPLIRAEIVRTVGEYDAREADSLLAKALEDMDAEVRMAACEAWGKRQGPQPATRLSRTLGGDIDIDVRLAAARALSHSKDPVALTALGEALEDKDPAMQVRAVKSLRSITGRDFDGDVGRWRQYVKSGAPQPAKQLSIAQRIRLPF